MTPEEQWEKSLSEMGKPFSSPGQMEAYEQSVDDRTPEAIEQARRIVRAVIKMELDKLANLEVDMKGMDYLVWRHEYSEIMKYIGYAVTEWIAAPPLASAPVIEPPQDK